MKTTGIYQIQSKIKPERIYIGSSVNIKNRWRTHLSDFRKRRRHSLYFQKYYNKYGVSDLQFSILESCSKEKLIEREQHYIDLLKPEFNTLKIAYSPLGYKHSEETKKKISETNIRSGHKPPSTLGVKWGKETGKKHSEINKRLGLKPPSRKGIKSTEESKRKMSKAKKGKNHPLYGKHHTEETKRKMSESHTV